MNTELETIAVGRRHGEHSLRSRGTVAVVLSSENFNFRREMLSLKL